MPDDLYKDRLRQRQELRTTFEFVSFGAPLEHSGSGFLKLSLLTGPAEWNLVLPRCRLALTAWPGLDEDLRQRFGQQFVMATARFGEHFAALAIRLDRVQTVQESLVIDQDQQHRFEAIISYLRQS